MTPVLSVRNLKVEFPTRRGILTAIDDVSFDIGPGEVLGWDAMRERGRHNATVRAIAPARLLVMSHEQFRAADGVSPRPVNASSRRHLREFAAG